MDILYPRCAGIDVHKNNVVVSVRCCDRLGKVSEEIRTFSTMTAELLTLSDWLAGQGVTPVAMESTGVYVVHRIGCPMLAEMLREFFGLSVCQQEVNEFKRLMALYYRPGYKRLLAKILSGKVLHIDETEVKLRSGKALLPGGCYAHGQP